jgi:hypothetical protein
MAEKVERPDILGIVIGNSDVISVNEEDEILVQNLGTTKVAISQVVHGLIWGRWQTQKWEWVEKKITGIITKECSPDQEADFWGSLPSVGYTWDLLDTRNIETQRIYWSRARPAYIEAIDCNRAIQKLLEHNRPHIALNFVTLHLKEIGTQISPDLVIETLEQAIRTEPEYKGDLDALIHYAGDILDAIETFGEIGEERLARLEFALLPFLEHGQRGPKILHKGLVHSPSFFVEVLSVVYRAEGEGKRDLSGEDMAKARLARDLLHSWKTIPGTQDDNNISSETLKEWVNKARELASACNRAKIADIHIGQVLSSASAEKDGSWPAIPVRDVIEEIASEELASGFITGIHNSRGTYTKSIGEGGKQERLLAERYRNYAEMSRDQWPRTAAVLNQIAESYTSDARREDIEAELEEDLWL